MNLYGKEYIIYITISNSTSVCLFVCLSGRPPKGEVGVPWHLKPGIRPQVQGLAFSNAPFPGQAWGTNLVLLPHAGGQPNTTPAVI